MCYIYELLLCVVFQWIWFAINLSGCLNAGIVWNGDTVYGMYLRHIGSLFVCILIFSIYVLQLLTKPFLSGFSFCLEMFVCVLAIHMAFQTFASVTVFRLRFVS